MQNLISTKCEVTHCKQQQYSTDWRVSMHSVPTCHDRHSQHSECSFCSTQFGNASSSNWQVLHWSWTVITITGCDRAGNIENFYQNLSYPE